MIKRIMMILILMMIFTLPVNAETYDFNDIYNEQYDNLGVDELYSLIDDDTKKIVDEFGFDPKDMNSIRNLSIENILTILSTLFKDGLKAPIGAFISIIAASILLGAIKAAEPDNENFGISDIAGVSVVAISIISPSILFFKAVVSTIKSTAVFLTGFVPIYAGILATAGKPTVSTLTSASLLLSAEICQQISGYIVLPFISVYLAITIASAFNNKINISVISSSIQKAISFCMTTVMTVFTAIISMQSVIGNSSDSAILKVFRLVAGSTPIIGGAVSEATGVVNSCINMLKNSAVIYAVICFAAFFLPVIFELLLWRLSLFSAGLVAGMLGSNKISNLTNSVGYVFSAATSITVNTFIMFVVSLTVVMITTGTVI